MNCSFRNYGLFGSCLICELARTQKKGTFFRNISILLLFFACSAFGQKIDTPNLGTKKENQELNIIKDGKETYDYVSLEKSPRYPGGMPELYKFLGVNFRMPANVSYPRAGSL